MVDVIISKMVDLDLPDVIQVFYKTFTDVGENWSEETATQHVKENFFGECHFVAKVENQIVGYIMGIPLTREKGLELFIDTIAVVPEFQRQGIGTLLWKIMLQHKVENKYTAIRLLTHPHLQSFNWYKKMGYLQSGWVEIYKSF